MIKSFVKEVLAEDVGRGDLYALISKAIPASAKIIAKSQGIFSGQVYADALAEIEGFEIIWHIQDGECFEKTSLLAEIKGKWTLFLGSDDCFSSNNSLLNLYEKINNEKYNNYDFIFSKVRLVDSIITRSPYEVLGDKDLKYYQSKLKNEMLFSHTGCLHRSTLFNMGLRFDNSYKIAGDYEFVLRAINLDITKVGKYDDILLDMGQGGLSTGSLSRVKTNIEAIKARISNGLLLPSPRLFYRLLLSLLCLFISKFFGETALTKTANLYRFLIGKNKRTSFK